MSAITGRFFYAIIRLSSTKMRVRERESEKRNACGAFLSIGRVLPSAKLAPLCGILGSWLGGGWGDRIMG
jgi:hypothetical protein